VVIRGIMRLFGGDSSSSAEQTATKASGKVEGKGSLKDLEHFVDYVVKALVDHPEEVRIAVEKENENSLIKINCNKGDIGKIVGKRGKTIMAIRSLVSGAAGRLQQRVSVEVVD